MFHIEYGICGKIPETFPNSTFTMSKSEDIWTDFHITWNRIEDNYPVGLASVYNIICIVFDYDGNDDDENENGRTIFTNEISFNLCNLMRCSLFRCLTMMQFSIWPRIQSAPLATFPLRHGFFFMCDRYFIALNSSHFYRFKQFASHENWMHQAS